MQRSSDTEVDEALAAEEKCFAIEPKKDCPHVLHPEYKKFDVNISGSNVIFIQSVDF